MRVVIGADHAGVDLKRSLVECMKEWGHDVLDVGTQGTQPVDYPDIAQKLGSVVTEARAERGVLICGSGVGASVAANKLPGIRAGLCHDVYSAHQGVEHDDVNVLVLGARVIGLAVAEEILERFLEATFSAEERHQRRVQKVCDLEQHWRSQDPD